ncbi:MAG: transcriptional activator NhaR [Deltaproteobacteria bacterium]|nr:transcriptional activator NhaR [Deltaproteobacteria bacterium]
MEWLNYHHLLYFWTVAREGSIARASVKLRLAQPTISAQIHALEDALGHKLFQRQGRNLVLTEMGRTVEKYADEIFSLGREMLDVVKERGAPRRPTLAVGIVDAVPKLVAHVLLQPALALPQPPQLQCHEDDLDELVARLSVHQLDLVLSDHPLPADAHVRAFSHRLGECGMAFFAAPALHERLRRHAFPGNLDGAPVLLPGRGAALRRVLDAWFEQHEVRPAIIGEFDDGALLKVFGQAGAGVFCAPSAIRDEVERQYRVRALGEAPEVREAYYAISVERRVKHPAVLAITRAARAEVFG